MKLTLHKCKFDANLHQTYTWFCGKCLFFFKKMSKNNTKKFIFWKTNNSKMKFFSKKTKILLKKTVQTSGFCFNQDSLQLPLWDVLDPVPAMPIWHYRCTMYWNSETTSSSWSHLGSVWPKAWVEPEDLKWQKQLLTDSHLKLVFLYKVKFLQKKNKVNPISSIFLFNVNLF